MEMTIIVQNKNNICTFLTFVNVNMHVIITNRGHISVGGKLHVTYGLCLDFV